MASGPRSFGHLSPADERLEPLVVVRQRLGEREEPPDGVLRAAEAHLDPAGLDRHACGQAGQARLEHLAGHRDPDPGEPGLADRGDDPVAARRLAAEGGPCPVFPQLAQELCSRERSLVAGELGAEVAHERRGAGPGDAEERLEVAAREQIAVQGLELLDGVGDGEEPPGRGGIGERRVGYTPCGACEVGRCLARILYVMLVDGRPRHKPRAGRGRGAHKGSYGTVRTGDGPHAGPGSNSRSGRLFFSLGFGEQWNGKYG